MLTLPTCITAFEEVDFRDDVPRGYKEIRMFVTIDADASPEELEEIVKLGPTYSPVYDTVTRPVPVSVQLVPYS
jgi:uncharacterized OsmC-like protein